MKKILVAVDLSDLATVALDFACKQALAFGSQVHLLHVEVPSPTYIGNEIGPAVLPVELDEDLERVTHDLAAMADYVAGHGVKADYELAHGPVIETIIEKAKECQADLIVMGAHNHGFIYRAFIGSVCSGVIKRSPCPVATIPAK